MFDKWLRRLSLSVSHHSQVPSRRQPAEVDLLLFLQALGGNDRSARCGADLYRQKEIIAVDIIVFMA